MGSGMNSTEAASIYHRHHHHRLTASRCSRTDICWRNAVNQALRSVMEVTCASLHFRCSLRSTTRLMQFAVSAAGTKHCRWSQCCLSKCCYMIPSYSTAERSMWSKQSSVVFTCIIWPIWTFMLHFTFAHNADMQRRLPVAVLYNMWNESINELNTCNRLSELSTTQLNVAVVKLITLHTWRQLKYLIPSSVCAPSYDANHAFSVLDIACHHRSWRTFVIYT